MSMTPSILSSTPSPALTHIDVASDPGLANPEFNDDSVTTRTNIPDRELDTSELSPLTPLSEDAGEDFSAMTKKVAPLSPSPEEYATESDEEVERSDDPPYSPGARTPDATESRLLHFAYRRPLGVSTSAVSKNDVNCLDPNGGQCLLTRDLVKETGIDNAHLLPQAWNNKPELLTRCEWALGQKYKTLHVDEPRNMVKIRKDWHWSYDQDMFLLMPPLKAIDAFDARRVALKKSPSDDPPDIMSLYGEEDIFEYRLVPLTKEITNIFRFNRDDDTVSPTTRSSSPSDPSQPPDTDHTVSKSGADPIPPTTSSGGHSASGSELLLPTTSEADDIASVSNSLPSTTPSVVDHATSYFDPLPPATSEVDCPTSDLGPPEPQPQLSGQGGNSISDDSLASNPNHPLVDAGTQTDVGLPTNKIQIRATQNNTSKMNLPAAKSSWSCHCYPFETLPVLRSHALPHFVLLNAGEKLAGGKFEGAVLQNLAVVVAGIFKIHKFQALEVLFKMKKIYNSWVHAVVPSDFCSKPQLPPSEDETTESGGEQEQAEAGATFSGTLREGAAFVIRDLDSRPERNDGQLESARGNRASTRQKEETLASDIPADAVKDTKVTAHALASTSEGSSKPSEPSRESTATSLPAPDSNQAAPFVEPAAPADIIAPAEAIRLAVPALVEPIEVALYDQVTAARKVVASGKVLVGTSNQTSRSVATTIPTGIPTKAFHKADGSGKVGSSLGKFDASGRLGTVGDESTQNKVAMLEDRAWTTVTLHPAPGGSEHKDSRRASGALDHDMVSTDSDVLSARETIAQGNPRMTAMQTQAPSESHVNIIHQGHLGNSQISSRAKVPNAQSGATLHIPVRVEGHSQYQVITQPVPALAPGRSYAIQHTPTTKDNSHSKSGSEGGLEQPPEQKRRRVARPSEGEAVLPASRIPRPVKFIDRMKKKTPALPPLRVSFVQEQREDAPVASGSRTRTERMSTRPDRTQDKDETQGVLKTQDSEQRLKQLDDDEQDGKGRKSAKSGKKRRYSRRSLGSG